MPAKGAMVLRPYKGREGQAEVHPKGRWRGKLAGTRLKDGYTDPRIGALKGRRYIGKTGLGEQAEESFVAGPKELYGASCAGLDAPLPEEEIGGEAKGNVDQEQA